MEQNLKEQQRIAIAVGLSKDALEKAYKDWCEATSQSDEDAQSRLSGMPLMAGYSLLNLYVSAG